MIRVECLSLRLDGKIVLDAVDLVVDRGEIFFLLGPSGCGKSTLLRCVTGLLAPDQGTIEIDGIRVVAAEPESLTRVRKKIGFAFQHGALLHSRSVLENVMLPIQETTDLDEESIRRRAITKLEQVGLADAAHKLPDSISGGMRKRAAIARALALDPQVLILDEPTAGLDPLSCAAMDDLIRDLNGSLNVTLLVVSHDLTSVTRVSHRAAIMFDGRIVTCGPIETLRNSDDSRIADFLNRRVHDEDGRLLLNRARPGTHDDL